MAVIDRYQILHGKTRREFPRFNVKLRKESWLHPIFWVLGSLLRKDFSTFTTTIFSTMYAADDWYTRSSDRRYQTMRHELIHVRQFHKFPLGRWAWPLNHLLMGLCYLFVLPVLLTMRAKFEREGYTQTMLVEHELHGTFSEEKMHDWARWMADTFGGPTYAWMWTKKKGYEWAMDTMRKINTGKIKNDRDRVDELRAA